MKPFAFRRALDEADAQSLYLEAGGSAQYIAGGTTLVDQLKLDLLTPDLIIDLSTLRKTHSHIEVGRSSVRIGAFATMSELANNPVILADFPGVADALNKAASPQIRNMATIGGNLLQRTRCAYFRDRHSVCNKRVPESGCGAAEGDSRGLAILGTSARCLANYAGDLAIALVSLDAEIVVKALDGSLRQQRLEELYRLPGNTPHLETTLQPGDLILEIIIQNAKWDSAIYHKVRDRASYAFALSSVAVALRIQRPDVVSEVRISVGGLVAIPWRCRQAEAHLNGRALTLDAIEEAAEMCFADAQPVRAQMFKVRLGIATVQRGLIVAAKLASVEL